MPQLASVRVIAGEYRGRKLFGPKTNAVRPTPDRVREALFNILGELEDTKVLDLFCGTGAVAIEALSRGATKVTLVDRNISVARKNLTSIGLLKKATLHKTDFRQALLRLEDKYDFIFVDPPYDMVLDAVSDILKFASTHLKPEGTLIFEHPKRTELSEEAHAMQCTQTRLYGDTALSFYVHKER